jgi:hypothetical protein
MQTIGLYRDLDTLVYPCFEDYLLSKSISPKLGLTRLVKNRWSLEQNTMYRLA